MEKIRKINEYEFPDKNDADKFDYIYKKYLELPFDFSMQILTGNDISEIKHTYNMALQNHNDEYINYDFICDYITDNYNQRLNNFKSIISQYQVPTDINGLNIFFFIPETYLPINQQQSFTYDYVMVLKNICEQYKKEGKQFFSHINFFIATFSFFIISDSLPYNLLNIDFNTNTENSRTQVFSGNLYDIGALLTNSFNGKLASEIIDKSFKMLMDGTYDDETYNFIGDPFLRSAVKMKKAEKLASQI